MTGAQALAQAAPVRDAVVWLVVLLAVVVVGGVVILWVRRRVHGEGSEGGGSLDLETIRRMHAEGRLTDAEFEAARGVILAQHGKGDVSRSVSPIDPSRVRAKPGFDLTGEALPRDFRDPGGDRDSVGEGPKN